MSEQPNELPAPADLEEARELGELYMRSLQTVRPYPGGMSDAMLRRILDAGRTIGAGIYAEGAPWTIDEFQSRIRGFAQSA